MASCCIYVVIPIAAGSGGKGTAANSNHFNLRKPSRARPYTLSPCAGQLIFKALPLRWNCEDGQVNYSTGLYLRCATEGRCAKISGKENNQENQKNLESRYNQVAFIVLAFRSFPKD